MSTQVQKYSYLKSTQSTNCSTQSRVRMHRLVHMSRWSQYAHCKARFQRRRNLAGRSNAILFCSLIILATNEIIIHGDGADLVLSLQGSIQWFVWPGENQFGAFHSHGPSRTTFTITGPFSPNNNPCGAHDKKLSPVLSFPPTTLELGGHQEGAGHLKSSKVTV